MRTRLFIAICCVFLSLLPHGSAVAADDDKDPQKTFDEVFGESYKKAIATVGTADDAELAKDLSKAVLTIDMPVSLMHVIAEKLGVLADKTAAAALPAVEALDKLAKKDEKQRPQIEARAIVLLEKAHAAGDAESRAVAGVKLVSRLVALADRDMAERRVEPAAARYKAAAKIAKDLSSPEAGAINAKLAVANEQLRRITEVDALEKRIEANPKDGEARNKLIRIHLVERDDPAAAVWFVGEGVDEATKRLLPIAAKEGAGADVKTLADLGGWYMEIASETAVAGPARVAMLNRAKGYYERFLAVHKENDLLKAKATLTLEQIAKRLKEAESAPGVAVKPETPGTAATPAPPKAAGDLTVAIDGPTITDPDRIERVFAQYARLIGKEYAAIGDDFAPVTGFDAKFPSSARETLAEVTKRMTTVKQERVGLVVRRVTVPPVPAEAEAVAMALPSFEVGSYGYVHSAEVAEILGPEEMLIKAVWLVDPETLANANWDDRRERDKIRRRQDDWNWGTPSMRLCGHPTAGLKVGDRIGMTGAKGKPLQFIIVKTEPQKNYVKPIRQVAVATGKLAKGLDDRQVDDLLTKRNLTRTDLVNIYLEAQRAGAKDAVANTIKRIEAKGAKVP
jgi:hypothetical protein